MSDKSVIPVVVREKAIGRLTLHVLESVIARHESGGRIHEWNISPEHEVLLELQSLPISLWNDDVVRRRMRDIRLEDIELMLGQVDDLISGVAQIQQEIGTVAEQPYGDAGITYMEHFIVSEIVLEGLQLFLETSQDDQEQPLWQIHNEAYRRLVKRRYNMRFGRGVPSGQARPTGRVEQLTFQLSLETGSETSQLERKQIELIVDLPVTKDGPPSVAQFREIVSQGMRKQEDIWSEIIRHLSNLTRAISLDAQEAPYLRNLIKAVLELAEIELKIHLSIHGEPTSLRWCHEFVVRTQIDLEDLKQHLDYLLQLDTSLTYQKWLFTNLSNYCRAEIKEKLEQAIIEHHLAIYDLDAAGDFLQQSQSTSVLKRTLAFVYRHTTWCFFGFLALGFVTLFVPLMLIERQGAYMLVGKVWLISGLILLYVLFLLPGIVLLYKMMRESLPYFQFVLPRLLGAVTIGFTPLVFDSLPWTVGIELDLIPYGALTLLAYAASLFYLLFEVHRVRSRFQNVDFRSVWNGAWKLFLLASIEALLIGTIISSLVLPVVAEDLELLTQGTLAEYHPWLSIGVYPKLIFFWAGIAMFIGAFAQLLWQGRRITEPI